MFDIFFVTNRKLCQEDFLTRFERLAAAKPSAIILREKDLQEGEYEKLARSALQICEKNGVYCILHNFTQIAGKLGANALHLPLPALEALSEEERRKFNVLGASCHCVEDALRAEKLGCSYVTAGHIFETDCKKGVPARGLEFLNKAVKSVSIPVYAIGGIGDENVKEVVNSGAKGACVMSSAMLCDDPSVYLAKLRERCHEI